MSTRSEFIKRCEEILSFIETYGALKHDYIGRLFPHSKKNVGYLIKNQRLYHSKDGIYLSTDNDPRPDKCLVAALGVLADIFEKVKNHARATAPAQISFITHSSDYYEIIYVSYGMEAIVAASLETQHVAKMRNSDDVDTTKRMIIVEDAKQMERLRIPGTTRYVLVHPDGSLTYHKARELKHGQTSAIT